MFGLLNPFALLCGLVSVAMLVMHGGTWLAVKAEEPVAGRARRAAFLAAFLLILLFALAGLWTGSSMGYRITGALVHDGPSNPLGKTAEAAAGAWLANYSAMPWTMLAPLLGRRSARCWRRAFTRGGRRDGLAWIASALSVAGVVATAGVSMFPFILPSSLDPRSSLTVWDASSSQTTLVVMLIAAVIFVPIIIAYTSFVYRVLRGRVTGRRSTPTTRAIEEGRRAMWYFSWVLGLGLACSFAILNAMWYEVMERRSRVTGSDIVSRHPPRKRSGASGRVPIMWPWIPAFAGMTMWRSSGPPIGEGQGGSRQPRIGLSPARLSVAL